MACFGKDYLPAIWQGAIVEFSIRVTIFISLSRQGQENIEASDNGMQLRRKLLRLGNSIHRGARSLAKRGERRNRRTKRIHRHKPGKFDTGPLVYYGAIG